IRFSCSTDDVTIVSQRSEALTAAFLNYYLLTDDRNRIKNFAIALYRLGFKPSEGNVALVGLLHNNLSKLTAFVSGSNPVTMAEYPKQFEVSPKPLQVA